MLFLIPLRTGRYLAVKSTTTNTGISTKPKSTLRVFLLVRRGLQLRSESKKETGMRYSFQEKTNIVRNRLMTELNLSVFDLSMREIQLLNLAVIEQAKEWDKRDFADFVNLQVKEVVDLENISPDWDLYNGYKID